MSIPQLAEKIGMTKRGLYSSIENKTLTVSTLEKISEVLEVLITVFFEDENDKWNKPALLVEIERLKKEYEDIKNINKLNENLAGSATREAANFKMLLRMFYSALIEIYTESFYNLQKELQIKYPGLNDSELNKIIDENYTLKKMQGIIRDLKPLYDE
jgi:transcriptional regulator with XRE-family HTH domain